MSSSRRSSEITDDLLIRRRHLPHWQVGGSTYFITFRSAREILPPAALEVVRGAILEGHGRRYEVAFGVLMPDHVHLLLRPRESSPGIWFDLSAIMKGIKGPSSRRINQVLGTSGPVWQKESFDRIVRDEPEFHEKWNYILLNPFKAGLVDDPETYPYFVDPTRSGRQDQQVRLKSDLPG